MTPTEHAEAAIHSLILAKLAGNVRGIVYWQTRVDYYTEIIHDEELKGGSEMTYEEKKQIIKALKNLGLDRDNNPFGDDIQSCLWVEDDAFNGYMHLTYDTPCTAVGSCWVKWFHSAFLSILYKFNNI